MKYSPIQRLDWYIIRKFLGTFFFSIVLIISICIVFDLTEKIDDFIENEAPLKAIIFDYYFNFAPYFANLFSGLFTFIAVIFFTSKMASDSEIIAILSSGVSYNRMLRPYLISATVICAFSYGLGAYVIPDANKTMNEFLFTYVKKRKVENDNRIHMQVAPGTYVYMDRFRATNDYGTNFTLEHFEGSELKSKLTASQIKWDREREIWVIKNYIIRDMTENGQILTHGNSIDTTLAMLPKDFKNSTKEFEMMRQDELINHIEQQKLRGVSSFKDYEIERHRRVASPFSAIILTLIGVSLASRKMRGGIGIHLGVGLLLSFSYIMFQQIAKVFAESNLVGPAIAMWIPNILYAIIGYFLYLNAKK